MFARSDLASLATAVFALSSCGAPQGTAPPPERIGSHPSAFHSGSRPAIERPLVSGTAEADAIVRQMIVLPRDNPWNEDISSLPVHPNSTAIIASVGADKHLDFNLDMNFVIVPAGQPRVPVTVTDYPHESDGAAFPIPDEAPIENWPMARNEDKAALPKPGQTLADFQVHGPGDRHLILVDPYAGLIHEFWRARREPRGWTASQASTFDLTTNRLRRDGFTSADAAGLPIFPAIVRFDDVESGVVRHAMRVSVPRSRKAYVYPATHQAGESNDPKLPRMGERLRLKATYDTSPFPPHARAVLEGLKRYGMIVADNGAPWYLSVSPDPRIVGLESILRVMGRDFEVVVTTGPEEGPRASR